jgi:ABC-type multidrug transport system fused ATPase/permease subunit
MFAELAVDFARRHPGIVASNLAFMLFMPVNEVLLPHLYGRLVDSISKGTPLVGALTLVVVTLMISQLGGGLRDIVDTRTQPALENYLRMRMLSTLFDTHDGSAEELTTGELVSKFARTPDVVAQWLTRINDYLLPYILVMVVVAIYLLYHDAPLSVALVLMCAALVVLLAVSPRACASASLAREEALNAVHEGIEERLRNIHSIYTSNTRENEMAQLDALGQKYQRLFSDTMRCSLVLKALGSPIIAAFFTFFMWRCWTLVSDGRMSSSTFVSLFMVVSFMLSSMMWVVSILRDVVFDWGTLSDTRKLLIRTPAPSGGDSTSPSPSSPEHAHPLPSAPEKGLGLHNVSFKYAHARGSALSGATIHFEPGEMTLLVGPIGAGKSTVLRLLLRLYMPDSGDLYLGGRWYSQMSSSEVRARVAYVPQDTSLFNRSVVDNIRYGNPYLDTRGVREALDDLGVAGEFVNLEHGILTDVGKNGSRLSGGQKQLVWCLRAVLKRPEVIVLDEPTASMDVRTKRLLVQVLKATIIQNGGTVIMVTHDPFLKSHASRVVTMTNATILSSSSAHYSRASE